MLPNLQSEQFDVLVNEHLTQSFISKHLIYSEYYSCSTIH